MVLDLAPDRRLRVNSPDGYRIIGERSQPWAAGAGRGNDQCPGTRRRAHGRHGSESVSLHASASAAASYLSQATWADQPAAPSSRDARPRRLPDPPWPSGSRQSQCLTDWHPLGAARPLPVGDGAGFVRRRRPRERVASPRQDRARGPMRPLLFRSASSLERLSKKAGSSSPLTGAEVDGP
jgi:hypothetical protein